MPDQAPRPGLRARLELRGQRVVALGRRIRRFRVPLVILPLVGGLVIAGVVGASLLSATVPDAATVSCWNGEVRPDSECPQPTGVAGLRWVFPAFDPHADGCAATEPDHGHHGGDPTAALTWVCHRRVQHQPVTITYVQRTDVDGGLAVVRRQYQGVRAARVHNGERLLWRARDDAGYRLTEAYARYPYTVTVSAPTGAAREAALARVQFRKAENVRVQPAVSDD